MTHSRVPMLTRTNARGISDWFSAMAAAGLLFHPDDDPATIVRTDSGERTFTPDEVVEVRDIVERMFEAQGDRVYEIGFPVFRRSLGITSQS